MLTMKVYNSIITLRIEIELCLTYLWYIIFCKAQEGDDGEESDEKLEEMRRKLAQNRRRTKLDLSAGLTDLSTGKVDNLVVQFIEKLKLSNAETRRKNSSEGQISGTNEDKDDEKTWSVWFNKKWIPVKKIEFDYGDEKRVTSMRYIVFQL